MRASFIVATALVSILATNTIAVSLDRNCDKICDLKAVNCAKVCAKKAARCEKVCQRKQNCCTP